MRVTHFCAQTVPLHTYLPWQFTLTWFGYTTPAFCTNPLQLERPAHSEYAGFVCTVQNTKSIRILLQYNQITGTITSQTLRTRPLIRDSLIKYWCLSAKYHLPLPSVKQHGTVCGQQVCEDRAHLYGQEVEITCYSFLLILQKMFKNRKDYMETPALAQGHFWDT